MMRSWENRPDTVVVDEPFYAEYLVRTGLDHPGRDDVIASQPTDAAEVVRRLTTDDSAPVHYAKHMTHHLAEGMDLGWVAGFRNVLLIRDPAEVVASYVRSRESCEPEDIGLLQQVPLLAALPDDSPVIDAGDFLRDPEKHLRWLCDWLGIHVHRPDAALARRTARLRRRLGAALVRRRRPLHRLRALAPPHRRPQRPRRSRSPRPAARRTTSCTPAGSSSELGRVPTTSWAV